MRIYFIGQKGIPAAYGGVENYVENLAVRLARAGHEPYVYTRYNYSNKRRKQYQGVNLINLPSISSKNLDAISHTFLAVMHVLFQRVDIIHFHSIGPSSLLWIIKLFKPRTPVIATFQSQCYLHQKWGFFAKAYLRIGEFILCKLADYVIVPSMVLKHYTAKRYQRQPLYIPNGVTLPAPERGTKELKKFNLKNKGYILTVGRLVRHKGVHYLIEAYKKLKTDKRLVIVGGGSYTDDYVKELKERAKGNPNIIFLGSQQGQSLKALFAGAYLFVQPSESEGLSIALLEAMSYGLPVLVSDIEENLEAAGDCGLTFRRGSLIDLRRQLKLMMQQPARINALGIKARAKVSRDYNWDNLAREILAVYRKAADGGEHNFFSRRIVSHYKISH